MTYSKKEKAWYLKGFFDNTALLDAVGNIQNPLPNQTPSSLRDTPPWQGESFTDLAGGEFLVRYLFTGIYRQVATDWAAGRLGY